MNRQITLVVSIAALMGGCASETRRVDADFRKSVDSMIQAQTYDPATVADPAVLAPDSGDGQRLKNALDNNRKDVPKGSTEVKQPIVLEVGSR
jgi:hypothetical protein